MSTAKKPKHFTQGISLAVALAISATACSSDEQRPLAQSETPIPKASPTYTESNVKQSLLKEGDIGTKWRSAELLLTSFKESSLRGCSDSKIELSSKPEVHSYAYGEPENRLSGANYAHLVAIYPDTAKAIDVFSRIEAAINRCPESRDVAQKKLPNDKFIHAHKDTWKSEVNSISEWRHIRGLEESAYSPRLSNINVFHFVIDYAQRGNMIFSSIYWQRLKPKQSSKPLEEKATELLEKQLERFGDGV